MYNIIKKFRKESGLTQEELAEKVGISRTSLCNIENEINDPSATTMLSISNALGKPVEQIFLKKVVMPA